MAGCDHVVASQVLSLVDKALTEVPFTAWEVGGSITTLDLSRNKISGLPKELAACTALTVSDLFPSFIPEGFLEPTLFRPLPLGKLPL